MTVVSMAVTFFTRSYHDNQGNMTFSRQKSILPIIQLIREMERSFLRYMAKSKIK